MADIEMTAGLEDGNVNQPEPSLQEEIQETHFGDSSGPVFCMYSKIAEQDDNTMAERWQKDADGILIFAGLFSAAVATFLSLSIPDLRPSPHDTSAFYLKNIYQNLADPSASAPSFAPSTVATPPPFSPPPHIVAVNLLWVFSLCMSLTCAIMATMLQQWARQYVRVTQPQRRSPRRRARIRALFSGSVDKLFIRTLSILLPCYLHFAVFLFFIGLLVFFFHVNHTIFVNTLWFFMLCMVMYSFVTFFPFFQSNSLLFTPISAFPASFVALLTCLVHSTFADRFKFKIWSIFDWLFEDVRNSGPVEDISLKRASEIDARILESTLNSLNEDDATEKFFAAIPDFFGSRWVKLLPTNLPAGLQDLFKESLYEFLDCTFRSTIVAESVKISRLIICLDASRATLGPDGPSWILGNILNRNWPELLQSVELGHTLRNWVHGNDEENVLYIRSIVSHIVASAEKRDDRWLALAADQPGMSEDLLRHYLSHGDSVLLANLINITRLTFRSHIPNWFHALPSKCDVLNTLPSLQYDFCALWDEIVLEAQNNNALTGTPIFILRNIRPVYVALHSRTDAPPMVSSATTTDDSILDRRPSSFPLCNTASHQAVEDASLAIQSVPHHSTSLVSGTRPSDIPASHTTRNPADELSFCTVFDAPQLYTPVILSLPLALLDSRPVLSPSLNVAAVDAKQGNTNISTDSTPPMANLYPHTTSGGASQQSDNDARPVVFPSPAIPTVTRSSYLPYEHGFASLSPHIFPQVISDLEAHITTRIRAHGHGDTLDLNIPILTSMSRHPSKSEPSTPDIAAITLRPGDSQQSLNKS